MQQGVSRGRYADGIADECWESRVLIVRLQRVDNSPRNLRIAEHPGLDGLHIYIGEDGADLAMMQEA